MMEKESKPVYFDGCFGWLHLAEGNRGAVICSAFGVEDLCTHRFMRHLGDELAAVGVSALRFDYHGTGDSLGVESDPERVQRWLDDIRRAIDLVKDSVGVSDVVLIGFRLGALLAATVASSMSGVSRLVLIDSPVSGNAHLREMRALGLLMADGIRDSSSASEDEGNVEVAGFAFSGATCDDLKKIELLKIKNAPAAQVLLAGKQQSKNHDRLESHLRTLGCNVVRMTLPGYDELVWNSSVAALPHDAFHEVAKWASEESDAKRLHPVALSEPELRGVGWCERPVLFGERSDLFAVHCRFVRDSAADRSDQVVVFLNHGSNHHVGWARMHVLLARLFAGHGIDSFRMDMSGVGDSPAQPGKQENQLYARHTQLDVHAAIDWLKAAGYQHITIVGHCAGAHLGFYSTVRDPRVTTLVMLNLQRFFWARGESFEIATRQSFRSSGWYWSGLRDMNMWRRLFKGEINVRGIAAALTRRLLQRLNSYADRILEVLLGKRGHYSRVYHWLRELSARKTRVLFVYSTDDGGLDEMEKYLGKKASRAKHLGNVKFVAMENADHNLTSPILRERYAQILLDYFSKLP